jgi:hypothetical protein
MNFHAECVYRLVRLAGYSSDLPRPSPEYK